MKKIAYEYNVNFDILDPKDYIIIEKDNQRISDKYVDFDGKKINEYEGINALKKGDVAIKVFYYIWFRGGDIVVYSKKPKYYYLYKIGRDHILGLKQGIRTKNSYFDFDDIKGQIVKMFSRDVKIETL